MARRPRTINLPAPYLKRVWLEPERVTDADAYPFCLPFLRIFISDEPESALSPSRQIELLKLLHAMERSGICQVIMATHAPLLMAYPQARLLQLTPAGLAPVRVRDTGHFRALREFWRDPDGFIADALEA
jgi:predicted ATPase